MMMGNAYEEPVRNQTKQRCASNRSLGLRRMTVPIVRTSANLRTYQYNLIEQCRLPVGQP